MLNKTTDSNNSVGTETAISEKLEDLLRYIGSDYTDMETAEASIIGFEVVSKGGEKYTVYKVVVTHSILRARTILRRYSDFHHLRAELLRENLELVSSLPFPSKCFFGSNLNRAYLERRMVGLQLFLGAVLERKDLMKSKALQFFFNIDSNDMEMALQKMLMNNLRNSHCLHRDLEYFKTMNQDKDEQIENLIQENKMLRGKKESATMLLRYLLFSESQARIRSCLLGLFRIMAQAPEKGSQL